MPGEMVPFSAKISNDSATEIKNTTVRLVQRVSKFKMCDLATLITILIQVTLYGQRLSGRVKKNIIRTTIFESLRDEAISVGGHQEWNNQMIQASV